MILSVSCQLKSFITFLMVSITKITSLCLTARHYELIFYLYFTFDFESNLEKEL